MQVYVWRLLATGTIEEKMYQRQLFKTQVASETMCGGHGVQESRFSRDELRELFAYDESRRCDTLALLLQSHPEHALVDQAGVGWRETWLGALPDATLRAAIDGDEQLAGLLTYACDVKMLEELGSAAAGAAGGGQRVTPSGGRWRVASGGARVVEGGGDDEGSSPCPSPSESEEEKEEDDDDDDEEQEQEDEQEQEGGGAVQARGAAAQLRTIAEGANLIAGGGGPSGGSPRANSIKRRRQIVSDEDDDE